MIKFISLFLLSFLSFGKTAELIFTPEFIFEKVLERKQIVTIPEKKIPEIFYASKTELKQFQDDIEPQWGIRPEVITNAYVVAKNRIYIMDDLEYYESTKRCMDDSLAHELTHFVQVVYQGWDINEESLEWDAVDIQTWFRTEHCKIIRD